MSQEPRTDADHDRRYARLQEAAIRIIAGKIMEVYPNTHPQQARLIALDSLNRRMALVGQEERER